MSPINTSVIGVGVQGERHAEKLAAEPSSRLVGVVDIDAGRAHAVADKLGVEAAQAIDDLGNKVEAVVIATPSPAHYEIAHGLLEKGIHVLVEKPFVTTMEQAAALVEIAEAKSLVLQVGHIERFNPVVVAMAEALKEPQFFESNRIAPFKPRSLDISVVLDLMIHDIDLIHSFVQSPTAHVEAVGRSVFSDSIDVANARIRFENGCVANITSSRISMKTERTLRVFSQDSYLSGDLYSKELTRYSKRSAGPVSSIDDVIVEKQRFGDNDALASQARAFLDAVAGRAAPEVSGRTAMEALATAYVIGDLVGARQAI